MDDKAQQRVKPKVLRLDGSRSIAYVEAGSGDTLLFIHGSLCDYRFWKPQLEHMSDRFRVIAPSLSHYYPQLPSMSGEPFSWRAHVEQITAFIPRLAISPIHVIGHSRGASIAYQVALQHPKLIKSLTLVDPGGPIDDNESGDANDALELRSVRSEAVELVKQGYIEQGLELFVDSTSRPGYWRRSAPRFREMARHNAATLIRQLPDLLPPYRESESAMLECSTAIYDGACSPPMYRRNAVILSRWIPRTQQITIEGASHGMTWTHSHVFNAALASFIDGTK